METNSTTPTEPSAKVKAVTWAIAIVGAILVVHYSNKEPAAGWRR